MAEYSPPTEDLPIFDNLVFISGDEPLTYNIAKKKFLRYPTAQGKETFQAIDVNGVSTFNNNIIQNNDTTIIQTDTTNNTTTNTLKATNIFGQLHLQKPSGANGGGLLFDDVKGLTTYNSQLYYENLITYMQNNAYNGKFQFTYKDGSGNTLYPLTLTQSSNQVRVGINTSSPNSTDTFSVIGNSSSISRTLGTSGTGIFSLNDNGGNTTRSIVFIPNTAQGNYNGIIQAGDISILGFGTSNGVNNSIVLSNWNNIPSGVRITATTSAIQFGSSEILLNSSTITTNGTNLSLTNTNVDFTSTIPPTSSQIIPASNDSSNKIPTTEWVQSAISASSSTNITPNSVIITPTSVPSPTAGINCYVNNNAKLSFSGNGGNNNSNVQAFVANNGVQFDFNIGGSTTPTNAIIMTYRINFTFWNTSAWGRTSCLIDFYPNRWTQGQQTGNQLYNINNKIDSNGSYTYTNTTYAPNGRQYWTYNQAFSGVSGAQALFVPHNGYFDLFFCIPDNSYSWQGSIEALNTTQPNTAGYGITLEVI